PAAIARNVIAVVDGRGTPPSTPTSPASRVAPGAYDLYLKGLAARDGESYESTRTAVYYFRLATGWQPRFGNALASLALADIQLLFDGPQRPDDLLPEAQASARKALEIDPALKDAHLALDTIRRLDGDVAAADEELDRLLLRQPSADLLA